MDIMKEEQVSVIKITIKRIKNNYSRTMNSGGEKIRTKYTHTICHIKKSIWRSFVNSMNALVE
jgi:hypothetical protein